MTASTAPADSGIPYAGLTPELMLDAIESAGLRPDGRLLALNSYENRVWQAGIEDAAPVIAKFYRPGRWTDAAILEEHAFVQQLADAEIPAVPALALPAGAPDAGTLRYHAGFRFAVFPRCGGREPALDRKDTLTWLGRFIGRIHAVGAAQPYQARPALDIDTFGVAPRDWLLASGCIPADLLPAWQSVAELALDGVRRCYERAGDVPLLRVHGDCHRGNVLWIDEDDARGGSHGAPGPHFVDFDDSRMAPAIQDIWMLLEGDRAAMQDQLADIVAGYEDFAEFRTRELWLVEALRTLRLLHYSAWLASRWADPAFPAAFPWFGTARYWQDRILELREQVALMDEAPLWGA
ncbi:serine/threonine protein kinase [Cupriavidus oxalaticus]|uniref:Stress response kinase A n=1 Tax=Cupriavidus oxalaticus TaxID=96344 RepID=A0A375G9W1_9BURK|nr:serine/threonine protein kinase [Cupriavidus oxalaticus]QRQ86935.1 serine/threonine protein kinase [Cupriavidus oxalaticus]QRQ94737.1 serine/threonine protein kinase [Cupriavidus oxalaticus]WQD83386.1 serine/threonine protein kinase [Cupriavidus oxalaticus]SPC16165.1 Protein RdoA [Cupriavidus oxalaticus]